MKYVLRLLLIAVIATVFLVGVQNYRNQNPEFADSTRTVSHPEILDVFMNNQPDSDFLSDEEGALIIQDNSDASKVASMVDHKKVLVSTVDWRVAEFDESRAIISDVSGDLFSVNDGVKERLLSSDRTIEFGGVVRDVNFSSNKYVYIAETTKVRTGNELSLMRFRYLDNGALEPDIIVAGPFRVPEVQPGGIIVQGNDGTLYMTVADINSPRNTFIYALQGNGTPAFDNYKYYYGPMVIVGLSVIDDRLHVSHLVDGKVVVEKI